MAGVCSGLKPKKSSAMAIYASVDISGPYYIYENFASAASYISSARRGRIIAAASIAGEHRRASS